MTRHTVDNPNDVLPLESRPPTRPGNSVVVDDSGRTIIAMLQKASEMAMQDCTRAMDVARKLSFQLHAAEERVREAETEVARFRERATRAEAWLVHIRNETEHMFFQR